MRRPSKKTIEEAILCCSAAAALTAEQQQLPCSYISHSLGISGAASSLAVVCYLHVPSHDDATLAWAEAEAWLRSGWLKGGDEKQFKIHKRKMTGLHTAVNPDSYEPPIFADVNFVDDAIEEPTPDADPDPLDIAEPLPDESMSEDELYS